ncbi:MAG TPA: AraC family transcriptional regulator [Capsulimonadaceae bacterium]|jgi:AraC-like DNA-binding protein
MPLIQTARQSAFDCSVELLGIDTPHAPGFSVKRPNRQGTWLLMCFRTPFFVLTAGGVETGNPGDVILHDPTFQEHHGSVSSDGDGFRNDWIHMQGSGVNYVVDRYGIPTNSRIETGQPDFLEKQLRQIDHERVTGADYWEDAVADGVVSMLRAVARQVPDAFSPQDTSRGESSHRSTFVEIRRMVLASPEQDWSVKMLASNAGLGENRFAVLYKAFFGKSPMDDVISARMTRAQTLLLNSDATIDAIAYQCGLTDGPYLSRLFKKRFNVTPGDYRRHGSYR